MPCGHCLAFRRRLSRAQERGAVTCPEVLARLLGLSDEEVLRVLTFLMAEAHPAGSTIIEVLGHLLAVDMDQWWSPDEAFFELLRDKEAINAMLAEVAGKHALTDTTGQRREVLPGFLICNDRL
jgi:ParB family chromosome partitioning protein